MHIKTSIKTAEKRISKVSKKVELKKLRYENAMLKKSLLEKEVLLKEIHHRMKNNLQVISSLLSLNVSKTKNAKVKKIIKESQDRIKTMALVHEGLYKNNDFKTIDFKQYIEKLISNIISSSGAGTKSITVNLNIPELYMEISKALPLGLIINEIITNSFKYAFKDRDNGFITVFMKEKSDDYDLTINDNGVGYPEDLDLDNLKSLGLHLVSILTEQLQGKYKIYNNNGAFFKLIFPKK